LPGPTGESNTLARHGYGVWACISPFPVVYALQIGSDIWVIHAFQKKSKSGIKTPKQEIDLINQRLQRLKEILK
jgi:phage-related protein